VGGGLVPNVVVKVAKEEDAAVERQLHEDSLDEERAACGQKIGSTRERVKDAALEKAVEILNNPLEYAKILDDAKNADKRPMGGKK
jgi:hypothetical protein